VVLPLLLPPNLIKVFGLWLSIESGEGHASYFHLELGEFGCAYSHLYSAAS